MLAHVVRGDEGEFHRLVDVIGKLGKPASAHDGAIGRHHVDDPFATNDVADFMMNISFFLRLTFGKGQKPTVKALY